MITLEPAQAYALWSASYPPQAHNPFMQAEERAMLSLLPPHLHEWRVLDAGCGSGRYLKHIAQRGAHECLGIDLCYQMLAQGQRYGVNVPLVQADLRQIPVISGWSQLTLCSLSIGHVQDLPQALSELARITAPGGRIVVSDIHPRGVELGWKRTFSAAGKQYAVHHTTHTIADWESACTHCGLVVNRCQEVCLTPSDLPSGQFDPALLQQPAVIVFELKR